MGGSAGALAKNILPAKSPAAAATSKPTAKINGAADFLFLTGIAAETAALPEAEDCVFSATTAVREESTDRFRRLRSARNSAAVWHRMSRSFSRALLMISSSLAGSSGTRRTADVG